MVVFAAAYGRPVRKPVFSEVSPEASGIRWSHFNAISDDRWIPEIMGAGCAFLDYDGDGWMDVYLVNTGPDHSNALYRNNHNGTFTDVTRKAGVQGGNFGMGVAVGDANNDGYPDLMLTGAGASIYYRNNGDGTFTNATAEAGLAIAGWTTSAAWFDYDGDGFVDLFVGSYVPGALQSHRSCPADPEGPRSYCSPRSFGVSPGLMFHNNRNGTFSEVGRDSVIGSSGGKALGVIATDVNNDGRMDLFVTNDTERNFLFLNRGKDQSGRVTWEETGVRAGVAYNEAGRARAGMGVDAWDFTGDGWPDLFVANLSLEMFGLFRNRRDGTFTDIAAAGQLGKTTRPLSGWGLKFFDYDNDGEADLIVANGYPNDRVGDAFQPIRFLEPLLLLHGKDGDPEDAREEGGPVFARPLSARGLAVGDYDNDGRADALITTNGGAPVLLHNQAGGRNNWLGLYLRGMTCNRDAIGARVRWSAGGRIYSIQKNGGGSYLSSQDPRVLLGLGQNKLDWLEIRWPAPSTRVERIRDIRLNRYVTVVEGGSVIGGRAKY
jgi:hypothetical protein